MTVSLSKMFRVFGRIGILSFGGPAAQISLMQTELVDRHKWLTETQFLQALSFCMLLPGPEAMQLATYAGWKLRGVPGGLLAGLLFVLPGAAVIFALAFGYAYFGQLPLVQVLFAGIKAAVVVIVFQALYKLSRRALKGGLAYALALAAFVGIFSCRSPFPPSSRSRPPSASFSRPQTRPKPRRRRRCTRAIPCARFCCGGGLGRAPHDSVGRERLSAFADRSVLLKLAVVTFGGAYAVLAYMTQEIVQSYGWLSTDQMIDALGLAETTPGPLILVTQFAGFMAGFLQVGPGLATVAALVTLWVTFVPCFLWIFAAAPYVESLLSRPRLKGAFDAISASVAGVILNLAVWFTLHVLFTETAQGGYGPVLLLENLSPQNALLVALASFLYLVMRVPMVAGLLIMALLAWGVDLLI